MFFYKQGYSCFVSRSIKPLFAISDVVLDIEMKVESISIEISNAILGVTGLDTIHLNTKLYAIMDDVRSKMTKVKPIEQAGLRRALKLCLNLENDLIIATKSQTLRIAPFCVKTWGTSGVGKTSFNLITMREVLRFNKYDYADTNIARIEPEKEFWENIKNDTSGIIIDDMCNTIHSKEKVNPGDILIKLVNNQSFFCE